MIIKAFLKLVARKIRYLSYLLIDQGMLMLPTASQTSGVVLLRPDGIGDFVLWLDAAQAITRFYRAGGGRVTLVANSAWSKWASELDIFDEVVSIDIIKFDSSLRYRIAMAQDFRKRAFAIALQPIYSRHYLNDLLARMCGVSERIGWANQRDDSYPLLRRFRDRWYTRLVQGNPDQQMEIIRNAVFVREIADPTYLGKVSDLRVIYSSLPSSSLLANALSCEDFYILFPGASWAGKRWPIESFAELAQRLHGETGWRGIICGSTSDGVIANAIAAKSDVPLLNLSGQTELSQLAELFSHANLVVSNDTAAAHIAASAGIPTVCILGGGHYGRFLPYQVEVLQNRPLPVTAIHPLPCFNCNWKCIYSIAPDCAAPCIAQVDIDTVWSLVQQSLNMEKS